MNSRLQNIGIPIFLKLYQCSGIYSFLKEMYFWEDANVKKAFTCLLASIYIEKLAVMGLKYIHKVSATNTWWGLFGGGQAPKYELNANQKHIRGLLSKITNLSYLSENSHSLAEAIEDRYSPITKQIADNISQIPNYLPEWSKQLGKELVDELTMSTNQLIIRALKNGKCARNQNIQLESLTDEEASSLIDAFTNRKIPAGVKIIFDKKNANPLKLRVIEKLLNDNEIRHAALACSTLQQSARDDNSIPSVLPQEMLNEIYSHTCPKNLSKEKVKNFVNNTSDISRLFKLKKVDAKNEECIAQLSVITR